MIDEGQKLEQILAGNAAIGISLQFLPQFDKIFLILYFPEVVELLHQFECFIDGEEALCLAEVGVGGVVELAHEVVELLFELLVGILFLGRGLGFYVVVIFLF